MHTQELSVRFMAKLKKRRYHTIFLVKQLFSRKIPWVVLTVVTAVSLDLIVASFLMDESPFLTIMVIVFVSFVSLAAVPSPKTKRAYKTVFLATLVVSTSFAFGLYTGLFESMILLDDSWIDISHSAVVFHLRNNGLTDWTVREVRISDITFTPKYPHSSLKQDLQTGDMAYFIIYYSEDVFEWIPPESTAFSSWSPINRPFSTYFISSWSCLPNQDINPSTFQNGSTYQVVFDTGGVLKHSYSFDIEARPTSDEELNVTATTKLYEDRVDFWFEFNNTGEYYSYIYSIQIANVTFYFEPLIRIEPSWWTQSPMWYRMILSFNDDGLYAISPAYLGNITSTATLRHSMLEVGTTYNVIVRTMTNNLYIAHVTI